ncbi:unnamed protein product [Ectocarpus sp. CCAP 1310/34]|nr:unnamed protein product [Ectocarpus sp. CCAP 1310/34]
MVITMQQVFRLAIDLDPLSWQGGGNLDDPYSTIGDVLKDGAEVEVVLMDAVEVDDVGAPVASEWFLKAFGSGEATKRRLNGIRAREEHEAKLASDEAAGIGSHGIMLGGFDVTVEGVAISGPLETPGEIRAAMEHDWRSADIGGESLRNPRLASVGCLVYRGSGGRMPGGSSPAMSFQDFAHGLHRYGIMPYVRDAQAGDAKGDERRDPPNPVRAVFRDAKRGHWPGDVTVRMSRFALLRRGLFLTAWFHEGSYQSATL